MLSIGTIDYIVARLLFHNSFPFHAINMGSQSLEKCLKSFIMEKRSLTDKEIKRKYGHDLKKLFDNCKVIKPLFSKNVRLEAIIDNYDEGHNFRYSDDSIKALEKIKNNKGFLQHREKIDFIWNSWLQDLDYAFYSIIQIIGKTPTVLLDIEKGEHPVWKEILYRDNLEFRNI